MSETKIYLPPENVRSIKPSDHPTECNEKCTMWRYPEQCKKAICSMKQARFAKKVYK